LWDVLAAQIERAGFTLRRAEIASGANGVTDFAARTVTVAPHLSDAQAAKTLAHELAHVTMHDNPQSLGGCRGRVGHSPTGPVPSAAGRQWAVCDNSRLTTPAPAASHARSRTLGSPPVRASYTSFPLPPPPS